MSTLLFVFEKLREGKYDRLRIQRKDGTQEIACPKIGGIPHDMVHFAVENVMAKRGFMRRAWQRSDGAAILRCHRDIKCLFLTAR